MKKRTILLGLVIVVCGFQGIASARGLLGQRYVLFEYGVMRPGDDFVRAIDDRVDIYSLSLNLPVNENIDFAASYSHAEHDGSIGFVHFDTEVDTLSAGVAYHFKPGETYDPFVRFRLAYVDSEANTSFGGMYEDDDDVGVALAGGLEIDLSEKAAVTPVLEYMTLDSESDVSAGIGLNYWFTERFFGKVSTAYWTDEGDVAGFFGVGLNF